MLKKLQIKLLSNSGELLNLVTCLAGQISVFRGVSPSEIRPYQRALTGSAGRERFSISLDGEDFVSDHHTLIGFGEPPPHLGMTVRGFLQHSGLLDGSIEGLLVAYGLAHVGDVQCGDLSQDEDRRVRLIAATNTPEKILIVNEPFEPIATAWRERFAELLISFARSRKGMVVVTSLSHRPECWIDNESIARIEVGQTAQRTIGFRGRSSTTVKLMEQLRQMLGDEEKVRELLGQGGSASKSDIETDASRHALPAAALGAVSTGVQSDNEHDATTVSNITSASFPWSFLILKIVGGIGVVAVALGSVYMTRDTAPAIQTASLDPAALESPVTSQITPTNDPLVPATEPPDMNSKLEGTEKAPSNGHQETQYATAALHPDTKQASQQQLLLDEYPEAIRTSLLQTARGILIVPQDENAAPLVAAAPIPATKAPTGNLFTLLQGASSKESEGSGNTTGESESYPPPVMNEPEYEDQMAAEQRREEIRQKFLEAIRTAAENRARQFAE